MMRTAPPAPSPGPIQTGPGEFTRMMSTGGNRAVPPGQPAAEEDEFAKLLRNPLAPRPGQPGPMPPSMPAAQQSATLGEFTRMLQTPTPLQPRPGSAPPAPASDPVLGPSGPGEFTRMMESPMSARGLAGQPLAAPPPRQPSGEATRAFQVNVPPAAPQAPPAEEGPSAYTRMFKAPAAPPPEPAPPKPQSRRRPPLRRKEKRIGRWWIIGGVIALIVVGVFLYFMIK